MFIFLHGKRVRECGSWVIGGNQQGLSELVPPQSPELLI